MKMKRLKHKKNLKPNAQLTFLDRSFNKPQDSFGGSLLKSNPKVKRPLATNYPIHLVLRSNFSTLRLPKNYLKVQKELKRVAKKYGIKIYKLANVGNHIHLVIKLTKLKLWQGFIRELTSKIAFIAGRDTSITQTAKERVKRVATHKDLNGTSLKNSFKSEQVKFWKHRPFTRIIRSWKKAFKTTLQYVELNQWEAQGHISRKEIKTLKDLKLIFESG